MSQPATPRRSTRQRHVPTTPVTPRRNKKRSSNEVEVTEMRTPKRMRLSTPSPMETPVPAKAVTPKRRRRATKVQSTRRRGRPPKTPRRPKTPLASPSQYKSRKTHLVDPETPRRTSSRLAAKVEGAAKTFDSHEDDSEWEDDADGEAVTGRRGIISDETQFFNLFFNGIAPMSMFERDVAEEQEEWLDEGEPFYFGDVEMTYDDIGEVVVNESENGGEYKDELYSEYGGYTHSELGYEFYAPRLEKVDEDQYSDNLGELASQNN